VVDTRCSTVSVDDAPADEDVFGSHAPIARAIDELITTEDGGRTIGLEGSWGSGKSTVVRLLDAGMEGPTAHLVVFDTWAHEGDPLRRSFLETLIESLSAKRWIEAQSWGKRRAELARRRRVEHTHPVSKIERPAILAGAGAALLAILVPLGAALIDAGVAAPNSWALWIGVAFYVALVALVATGAVWLLHGRSGPAGGALLSLFSVESVTESSSETIETPDPTSLEFESMFTELMHEALGDDPARRLVLVVDNLDRVSPDDARSIWATLQTFLHHSHADREPWLNSLWVLLPYDRGGIARLWDSSAVLVGDETQRRASLVDSFIDKSIQVRFEVPLPLLSEWRTYLESKLRSALPDCGEADGYTAYRMYARQLASDRQVPSPREVKQYVNRIGALHRRWQHELPFASLAYYASLGLDGIKVAERIGRGELPGPLLAGLLPEDIDGHLAAIAFNTDPVRARQLLLGPPIEHALSRETSEELLDLLDRPGFWEALPQSPTLLVDMGTAAMLTAARRLLEVPEEQRPEGEWREVTLLLGRQGLAVEDWPPLTSESADEMSGLLSLLDQRMAADIAERATAAAIPPDGAAAWSEGAQRLLSLFEWLTVRASGAPEAVCAALAHFARLDGWAERADRLKIDPSGRRELDDVIVERIAEEPVEAFGALVALHRIEPDIKWDSFVGAAVDRLRNGAPTRGAAPRPTPVDSRALLGILRIARQGSSQERRALVDEGVALEYAWLADQEGDTAALGDWLYEELREFSPEAWASRSYPGYAASGKHLVEALLGEPSAQSAAPLAQAIERQHDFGAIESIGASGEGEALACALVVELWESEQFTAALDGRRFRALWPHIARAGGSGAIDLDELIRGACASQTFVEQLESEGFAEDWMGMYGAVVTVLPSRDEAARLAEWVAASLSNLTLAQWQAAMADSDEWLGLLAAVRNAAPSARIGGAYAQGLAKFLEQVAEGRPVAALAAEQWERVVVPLIAPSIERAYAEGVARAAAMAGGQVSEAFFALVGDTLAEPAIFTRPEVLAGLLPSLVTERNIAGRSWLIRALSREDVRKNAPEGGFSALAEVVRSALAQEPDDVQSGEIAELIDLDVESRPNP